MGLPTVNSEEAKNSRIFIDTVNGEVDGKTILNQQDHQRLKVIAQVFPATLDPNDFEVLWELYDPDDPANHADIDSDPNGGDNTGNEHEGEVSGTPVAHWFTEADANHSIVAGSQTTRTYAAINDCDFDDDATALGLAKTEIAEDGGKLKSSVYMWYSDDGGDNFKVKAVLVKKPNTGEQGGFGATGGTEAKAGKALSGMLTVWRKRMVVISAMVRSIDDVRVDCIAAGPNGVIDSTLDANDVSATDMNGNSYILPGADGVLDSTRDANDVAGEAIIAGTDSRLGTLRDSNDVFDDDDDPTMILPGTNGVLQSVPNTIASWYPGDSLPAFQSALRRAYAGVDPGTGDVVHNQNPYIDIVATDGKLDCTYDSDLVDNDPGPDELGPYALNSTSYHDGNSTPPVGHPDYTYNVIGIRKQEGFSGDGGTPPHCFIALYWRTLGSGGNWPQVVNTVCHELGHLMNVPRMDSGETTCISYSAIAPAYNWCPAHVADIRRNVTRQWADHGAAASTEMDSD